MTFIKANEGKIIPLAQAIRDVGMGTLTLTEAAQIARGKAELPDELFDLLCMQVGNPDLYFDLV